MAFVFAALFGASSPSRKKPGANLSPAQAEEAIRADATMVILDVRTLEEYRSRTGHLEGAILLPVQELEQRIGELEQHKDRALLVYCRVGNRSRFAQMILEAHGFTAANMTGGITQWNDEHRPVILEPSRTPVR